MIIYNKIVENGKPIYEIITKTFKSITVKCDESFTSNDTYKLLSLLESDVDQMASD
ncbi:C1q-binding complement inhibitor VraX [Staphylococcus sp. SQ8-PEA]|uniref:Protein VraX n=1 Tax=Staphylococcus marylandisciuri TaxID=2981529 RepID=A0ABT2QRL8_9STAP|nr:C1q-binding complement inhibitor VraX [Staphylococcus marylandisciuri]MCU5746628.1 C1q-binding complement inhibitor VraX [Staphylococcus marylandisciuri]